MLNLIYGMHQLKGFNSRLSAVMAIGFVIRNVCGLMLSTKSSIYPYTHSIHCIISFLIFFLIFFAVAAARFRAMFWSHFMHSTAIIWQPPRKSHHSNDFDDVQLACELRRIQTVCWLVLWLIFTCQAATVAESML